jgi:hypothetical protein
MMWIPFHFAFPLTNVRHTYQLPTAACVNGLTSDLWTWEMVRERLFVLFLFLPISGIIMIWSKNKIGFYYHVFSLFCLFVWAMVLIGYNIQDIGGANLPPDNEHWKPTNLAHDPRYCLFYAGYPGTEYYCFIQTPCTLGGAVDPLSFRVNPMYKFRVGMNLFMVVFIISDWVFSINTWYVWLQTGDAKK